MKPKYSSKVIALTGNIASGKSTVAQILKEKGYPVFDADQIAKDIRSHEAKEDILKLFGTENPKEIRKKIFNHPELRQSLENLLFPLIQARSEKLLHEAEQSASLVFYEASLLIESGRHKDFQKIILVETSPELQIKWLCHRDGLEPTKDRQLIDSILSRQLPSAQKRDFATHFIKNTGSLEDLKKAVDSLIDALNTSSYDQ